MKFCFPFKVSGTINISIKSISIFKYENKNNFFTSHLSNKNFNILAFYLIIITVGWCRSSSLQPVRIFSSLHPLAITQRSTVSVRAQGTEKRWIADTLLKKRSSKHFIIIIKLRTLLRFLQCGNTEVFPDIRRICE